MITIPQNRKWTQTNSGEVFGSLYSSYNVNFDQEGYLNISPKSVSLYSNADNSDFNLPISIFPFDSEYFILTASDPFTLGTGMTLTQVASAPASITENSDALAWQGRAYVTLNSSSNNSLSYWDGSSWTNSVGSIDLEAGKPHPMEVFLNKNALAIGNGNTVLLRDTSHASIYLLTLPTDYEVTCLKYLNANLYIGTRSTNGRNAKIFVWNGGSTEAQAGYDVSANWVFSLETYKGGLVCMTSEGQLLQFSGGGFVPLANLPVYYSDYRWVDPLNSTRRVFPRGMVADGDLLYINLDGAVSYRDSYFYLPNQPSGVWCYDPNVGLYCRHLSTTDPLRTISVSSLSSDTLTLASSIKATTGEPVLMSAVGSLTGVEVQVTYYIIKVSDTTIKLAVSPADALAGTAITLGGSAGAATVKVVGYNDYGERDLSAGYGGAIGLVDSGIGTYSGSFFQEIVPTTILWGVRIGDEKHLNCLSSGSNIGGFITNKLWSSQVKDNFQKLYVKYSGVNLDSEKIVVKSRDKEIFGLPTEEVSGTFSTSRILGSTSSLLNQVAAGHNVNLITGNGAGQSVEVISISGDEYTLSEALANVASADATTFSVDNFRVNGEITNTEENIREVTTMSTSSWLQVMFELRGQNVKIEELQLITVNDKPSK